MPLDKESKPSLLLNYTQRIELENNSFTVDVWKVFNYVILTKNKTPQNGSLLTLKTLYRPNGMMIRVFATRPGFDPTSSHIKYSKKMVLDASLLNTQHNKVWI